MLLASIPRSDWAPHSSACFLLAPKVSFARVDNDQQDTSEEHEPGEGTFPFLERLSIAESLDMPSYNIPSIEGLTNAIQDAICSARAAKEFGAAQMANSGEKRSASHSKSVERAVERFVTENRDYEKKTRRLSVGKY